MIKDIGTEGLSLDRPIVTNSLDGLKELDLGHCVVLPAGVTMHPYPPPPPPKRIVIEGKIPRKESTGLR